MLALMALVSLGICAGSPESLNLRYWLYIAIEPSTGKNEPARFLRMKPFKRKIWVHSNTILSSFYQPFVNRGFSMRAHVLINLSNKLGKRDKMCCIFFSQHV